MYKILRLRAENIKTLKVVDIVSEGKNFIEITGKNGQGKTSILDSIMYGLCGQKYIPQQPIRNGEEFASVEIDIGEFTVRRLFTPTGSTIKITNKDGFATSSPQSFLDKIIGTLSFDPVAFTTMDKKKRIEMFRKLSGVDTTALDEEYQRLYAVRTELNSYVNRGNALVNELIEFKDDIEVPDIATLQSQRNEAFYKETQYKNLVTERDLTLKRIIHFQEEIKKLEENIKENHRWLVDYETEIEKYQPINIALIDEKIANIQPLIVKKQKHQEYLKAFNNLKTNTDGLEAVQKEMDDNRLLHKQILESANLPVPGLSLAENELYYNGFPFEQLSQAEKLKVAMAMAIAEKPKLRIVRIIDGSLLDHDSLKTLEEIANEHDFQVWIETVCDDKPNNDALYIKNGEVA